ncbi:MAG: FHA domain-containing protein, partial [Acidobacteria bacterium]
MAKLIIYRGDTLDREIELAERNARIGRGDQNEIVLPDPAKSVSRFHAELRFEQGRYTIVDLNSQNGTWVGGRRVPQVVMEPGVPVVLGTYRIVLKKEESAAQPEATDATLIAAPAGVSAPPPVTSTSATMVGGTAPPLPAPKVEPVAPPPAAKAEPPSAPKPELPKPVPAPPKPLPAPPPVPKAATAVPAEPKPAPKPEASAPPKPAPAVAPKPEPPKPAAAPVAAAPPPAPAAAAKPAANKSATKGLSKGVLVGGFAALVLLVMVAAVFLTPLKDRIPGLSGGEASQQAEPQDGRLTGVPAPPPAQPVAETVPPPASPAAAPASAPPPVAQPSATAAPAVPAARAPGAPAGAASRAGTGGAPRAPAATAGGRRGREAAPPPAKPLNLAQTLEEARSAMIKGDYLAAIAGSEAVLKVDPKYPSAADLLGVAKGGAKNAAQLAVDSGNKAEMSGDYAAAATQYDRAQQLDPDSTAVSDAIRRMKARMQSEGEDAFKRARQYDAMGRAKDAIP